MPADLELAFSSEPIIGWRVWRVRRPLDGHRSAAELAEELLVAERAGEPQPVSQLYAFQLRSLTERLYWPPGRRVEADCRRGIEHTTVPSVGCDCGFWALRDRADAELLAARYSDSGGAIAAGSVALWGHVVEQRNGWRGQFAYPRAIDLYGAGTDVAEQLAGLYEIGVAVAAWPMADTTRAA